MNAAVLTAKNVQPDARSAPDVSAELAATLSDAVARACDRIAPSWPLDRQIAVNPHAGWIDLPIEEAAAAVGVLAGMRLLPDAAPRRRPLVADLAGWRDTVVHQISQHCAAHADAGQARWHLPTDGDEGGLYRSWLARVAADRGLAWPQGRPAALALIAGWPRDPMAAIARAVGQLALPVDRPAGASADRPAHPAHDGLTACLTAWLLDLNGWAATCAGWRWQARQVGGDDPRLLDLLAIRATWDALLAAALLPGQVRDWARGWGVVDAAIDAERLRQHAGWQGLEAGEAALQAELIAAMARASAAEPVPVAPRVQAVFCIDVRSERLRRALEAADPAIATRGFAGFFGLPIDHRPAGTDWRQPQLPGLLAPSMTVDELVVDEVGDGDGDGVTPGRPLGQALAQRRRARLAAAAGWDGWRATPASAFSFVEACGVLSAGALLRASLPQADAPTPWAQAGLRPDEAAALRPRLAIGAEAGADLAAGVLRAMGLVDGFAPLLLLCGHASRSANNPHAAGLDCGACGGQSGEVNARALAALLNDPAVRAALRHRGIDLPDTTHALAGLHGTTTDEVTLFDTAAVPAACAADLQALQRALAAAGDAARAERAPGLGLGQQPPAQLLQRLRERAGDWAETRPEWGLVDNAAFIAAPRARTRGAPLGGRVFLHDHDPSADADRRVLTLILTAPVVVANWINLQYLASSVDPQRQGAGNKLLHNVVGGGVGVFEGNGGDLRIGLPWQSVHDGWRLRHTPRRLSVFVEAPREAIDAVLAAHETVRQLVDHGWLHLLAIEGEGTDERAGSGRPRFWRRQRGGGWAVTG